MMAGLSLEQQVIRDIRRNNGVEDELLRRALQDPALGATIDHLKGGYARALVILSDELYAKPAHCVLELIQNAVDNSYAEDVSPTLEMELHRSNLQIWCNEVGFNEANVKAFCSIGNSTKKNKKGYIGEKGIGAKSMFKVATKVTVQSRGYSFVLDREKELGMISPIWVDTAVQDGRQDWTGMNLDFGPNTPFDDLKAQILDIRDTILLFLPKLSIFTVNISGSRFSIERSETGNYVSLRTTSESRSTTKTFMHISKIIKMHVSDPKREGQDDTEIILAFPLKDNGQPDVSTQPNVHAFLPLRRVGFKFLVQADFLTAANREDVLTDNGWNITIRNTLPAGFVDAVVGLFVSSSLQFTWPRFLPREGDISEAFFKVVAKDISQTLKSKEIIKCSDGVNRRPGQVRFVGDFIGADGQPLVPVQNLSVHYASSEYPEDVVKILNELLGVTDMKFADFLSGLLDMVNCRQFNHDDTSWLENICCILGAQGVTRKKMGRTWKDVIVDNRIRRLPLVQMRDGTWTTCGDCDNYFFASERASFPSGLNIQVISLPHLGATHRRSLLRKLGVRDLDNEEVVNQIIELHRSTTPSFEATLEQIEYLYRHRSDVKQDIKHIYLYDQDGTACRGNGLLMDDPRDDSPDRLSQLFEDSSLFVHEGFCRPAGFSHGLSRERVALMQWQEWLIAEFDVRTVPSVVNGLPTSEFAAVIERLRIDDAPRLFRTLKRFWKRLIAQVSRQHLPSLKEYFGKLEVRCANGQVAPLRTTFFPSRKILQYGVQGLPLLDISDVSGDWSFLSTVGVSMEPDGGFFLKKLIALSQTPADHVNSSTVASLYEHISSRFVEFRAEAIAAFKEHALILFDKAWYNSKSVVWKGPPYLTLMPAIEDKYRHLKVLFQDRLRIEDAPPDIIAKELRHFSLTVNEVARDSPEFLRLMSLLRHASLSVGSIARNELPDWTQTIRDCPFFPVNSPPDSPTTPLKLVPMSNKFFIRDTGKQMYMLFRNVVPFLALGSQHLYEASGFLEHLGIIPERRIDSFVSRTVEIDGRPITAASSWDGTLNEDDSDYFNAKLPYLQRFHYYRREMRPLRFTEFRVYNVSRIVVSCTLAEQRVTKKTQHETWLDPREHALCVFLAGDSAATAAGRLHVAKSLADAMNIDSQFMINVLLTADHSLLDAMMKLEGIGTLTLSDDSDGLRSTVYKPAVLPMLPQSAELLPQSSAVASAGTGTSKSRSRRSRATKSFFGLANQDTISKSPAASLAVIDPQQTLYAYLASHRGRGHFERLGTRARSTGIPSATCFKDPTAAPADGDFTMPAQERSTSPSTSSKSSARSAVPRVRHLSVEGGATHIGVDSIAEELDGLSLSPTQASYVEQAPSRALETGLLGEHYVFELLKSTLPNFTADNWTSELRGFADLPPFIGTSYADFQYHDSTGEFTRRLLPHEPEVHGATPEVYIEVKATSGNQDEIFHVKRQQFLRAAEMWRGRHSDALPARLYVLFRVSNIDGVKEPVLKAYMDVHDLLARGIMRIESPSVGVRIYGEEV